MKSYTVYWRFKGKPYLMLPMNVCTISASTKKEVIQIMKSSLENVKIIKIV